MLQEYLMATYSGERVGSRVFVRVDDEPLCPRPDLHPLSPSGFDWGYLGNGPSQLALAILADHWPSDENRALRSYRPFMRHVLAQIRADRWELSGDDVDRLLANIGRPGPVELGLPATVWEMDRAG
jgi:hypothetical protein